MKTTLILLCTIGAGFIASGRPVPIWTYQDMTDKSDLVVIAKPVATTNTAERTMLLGVQMTGWETELEVRLTIRGERNLKKIVFHHDNMTEVQPVVNGPNLVSFDPRERTCFLLFLHKDPDGRYSPITGQTDPALGSVVKLEGGPCSFDTGK
jgi:hypothetical protein